MDGSHAQAGSDARWTAVADWAELERRGRLVVKPGPRQILLVLDKGRLYACNNNCPHEGYPLSEGTFADGEGGQCLLTCNWHNWKFDLDGGETLVGGDRLRRYPVRRSGERVEIDLAEPPPAERRAAALAEIDAALPEEDYGRIARGLGRLQAAGGTRAEAIRHVLAATHDRLEFGMGHAHASAPDWLEIGRRFAADAAEALVPPLEIVGYLGEVSLRQPRFPYPEGRAPWDAAAFLAAVEAEDEAAALACIRGALAEGLPMAALWPVLAKAALAHYADFGHQIQTLNHNSPLSEDEWNRAKDSVKTIILKGIGVAT